jgi:hypothetical protein
VKKLVVAALSSPRQGLEHGQEDLGAGMDVVDCGYDQGAFYSVREAVERRGGSGRRR